MPELHALRLASRLTPAYPERISSRTGNRPELIDLSPITHFYAEDKLTFAVAETKSFIIDQAISELESRLAPNRFFRIHRSCLVNPSTVAELYNCFGGRLIVRANDSKKTRPTASKDRARELRLKLGL